MKKTQLALTFLSFFISFNILVGQQIPEYSFLRENMGIINPAFFNYSFIEDNSMTQNLSIYHNQQWLGIPDAPVLSNAKFEKIAVQNGSYPVKPKSKWGVAFEKSNSGRGALIEQGVYFNYGYSVNLSEFTTFSAGLNFRAIQEQWNIDPLTIKDKDDLILESLNMRSLKGLFDIGIFLRRKSVNQNSKIESWYWGLSGSQASGFTLNPFGQSLMRPLHLNILFGCFIGKDFSGNGLSNFFEPLVLIRYFPPYDKEKFSGFLFPVDAELKLPFTADFNVRYTHKNTFFLGTGVGWQGKINFETGYQFITNNGRNRIKYKLGVLASYFPIPDVKNNLPQAIYKFPSMEMFLNISIGKR